MRNLNMTRRYSAAAGLQQETDNVYALFSGYIKWYEMSWASALTIGLRLGAIQQDIALRRVPDFVELGRMVNEKALAWQQAGQALFSSQQALSKLFLDELLKAKPTRFDNFPPVFFGVPARWTALMLRGADEVMDPYHEKSIANARRLSRKATRH
jgi:hypothetical protein